MKKAFRFHAPAAGGPVVLKRSRARGTLSLGFGIAALAGLLFLGLFGQFGPALGLYPYSSEFGITVRGAEELPPSAPVLRELLDRRDFDDEISAGREKARSDSGAWHLLGTDQDGRDIFIVTARGVMTYLVAGSFSVAVSTLLGIVLGSMMGYYHGRTADAVAAFVASVLDAFPRLVVLIVVAFISSFSLFWLACVLGILNSTRVAAAVKGRIVALVNAGFVEAAKELGVPDYRIILRHLLWYNCRQPIVIEMTYAFASVILTEATLTFINASVNAQEWTSWGAMIYEGLGRGAAPNLQRGIWWQFAPPAAAIAVTVIGLNALADGLAKRFEVRESQLL